METATAARSARQFDSSAFLPIAWYWRSAIVTYFFLYRILFPIISAATSAETVPFLTARILAEILYTSLLAFPFLMRRTGIGWVHPLILPTIFITAKSIAKQPLHLIAPFDFPLLTFDAGTSSGAISLIMSDGDLALTRLGYSLIGSLALACYYAAFFLFKPKRLPSLRIGRPKNLAFFALTAVTVIFVISSAFVIIKGGGLGSYIVAMRGGRVQLFEGLGPFLVLGQFAPIPVLVWFAYAKRPFSSPLFLAALGMSLTNALLIAGSRSDVLLPLTILVMLWWMRKGKVLVAPALAVAMTMMAVFGLFGMIRQDYGSTQVDTKILSFEAIDEWYKHALQDVSERGNEESALAAFAGANKYGLLWGKTYIGGAAFWIPRALWSGKPRSADAYNMWINFAGLSKDTPLHETTIKFWGIPVSAAAEAYWNFHIPGVIVFFSLFGMLHRWLAELIIEYRWVPALWVGYLLILIEFSGTTGAFVATARDLILLLSFLVVTGIVRLSFFPYARSDAKNVNHTLG